MVIISTTPTLPSNHRSDPPILMFGQKERVESFNYSKRNHSVHPGLAAGGFSMHPFVAFGAQRDQVLFDIASRMAAEFEVMHLQALHATADLAAPAVALQYLSLQFGIARRIESESRIPGWR